MYPTCTPLGVHGVHLKKWGTKWGTCNLLVPTSPGPRRTGPHFSEQPRAGGCGADKAVASVRPPRNGTDGRTGGHLPDGQDGRERATVMETEQDGMESSRKVSPRIDMDARGAPPLYISVAETYFYQSSPNSSTINNIMIHTCNFCNYQTPYTTNLRRHQTNKHALPVTLHSCVFCNYKSEMRYNLRVHMQNIHKFYDTQEAGTQTDESMQPTFQKEDVLKLMDECFDVFQMYMKIKMQLTDFEIEEMIEEMIKECIDVTKYAMKQKISEQ